MDTSQFASPSDISESPPVHPVPRLSNHGVTTDMGQTLKRNRHIFNHQQLPSGKLTVCHGKKSQS
jgi:hypothetical protein